MKVILDSNVYIAAYIARTGICHEVLEHCLVHESILMNDVILHEVRQKLEKKIKLPRTLVDNIIFHISQNAEKIHVTGIKPKIQCRDPKDVPIIELLIQSKAKHLITGDKDLLEEKTLKAFGIISPRQFMRKYM